MKCMIGLKKRQIVNMLNKTMKLIIALLLISSSCMAQTQFNVLGSWKLKSVVDSVGQKHSNVNKYKLSFYSDSTYLMDFGGTASAYGSWALANNKIKFDAKTVSDPCFEWKSDKEFKSLELNDQGMLVIDMFICGNTSGKSYFKKMKRIQPVYK